MAFDSVLQVEAFTRVCLVSTAGSNSVNTARSNSVNTTGSNSVSNVGSNCKRNIYTSTVYVTIKRCNGYVIIVKI